MPAPSLNMIFTGNPGTGKTTAAKLVGKIMKDIHVLEKGHFVSVTRADLVADFIGGTAPKTTQILEKALGGVLFIDEAYSLARGGKEDFGKEAIDTIVEFMERNQGKIIAILAGYNEEMKDLAKQNSGLISRFPKTIEFEDYTSEQMVQIARVFAKEYKVKWTTSTEKVMMAKQDSYFFSKEALSAVKALCKVAVARKGADTGNGRFVRNILDQAKQYQAERLVTFGHIPNEKELQELTIDDFHVIREKVLT